MKNLKSRNIFSDIIDEMLASTTIYGTDEIVRETHLGELAFSKMTGEDIRRLLDNIINFADNKIKDNKDVKQECEVWERVKSKAKEYLQSEK